MLFELPTVAASLGLVLLLSLPFFKHCSTRCLGKGKNRNAAPELYEDEDGVATEESQKAFSDLTQRVILLLGSVLGLSVSAVFLVLALLDARARCVSHEVECDNQDRSIWLEQCIVLAAWFLILLQSIVIFGTHSSITKYDLGKYAASACVLLAVAFPIEAISWRFWPHSPPASDLYYVILVVQFVIAVILCLTFVLLPRRPAVFKNGRAVDRQHTDSLLGKVTFAWAGPVLDFGARQKTLNPDDVPVVSNEIRARTLHDRYFNEGSTVFWRNILWSNKSSFFEAWILQALQAVAQFLPQIALYFILRFLEARDQGAHVSFQLWMLVVALGLSDASMNWLDAATFYAAYCKLGVPVYEQVATIVFGKAIRKKDVKGSSDKELAEASDEHAMINSNVGPTDEDTAVGEDQEEAEEGAAKTKQSTINLIGVDGKRISDFATYNCMLIGSLLKITFAVVFLVELVGWIPMLSGFGVFMVLMPLNWYVTSRYAAAQDALMKIRDQKMVIVTEALQGIRQIKFSALEREWYEKIDKTRTKELKMQWRAFSFDTVLISIWIFGPVALSAVALAVYVIINKSLSASVAFTTIGIFESIEVTLAVVPELITDFSDAVISSRRVQDYLDSVDKQDDITPGEQIIFRGATVCWPSDQKEPSEEVFRLKELNIEFPKKELSVISGRTGAGKSLLLSSIIGESDILEGIVTVPRPPPLSQRFDHKANKDNWCIDSAVAYVSQIPWIENATIKDNILFGLPFDESRYKTVLHASALEKDLEILEDGDLTDIGANGINLSGGQKWRVSFARALYSRAGILVLDDIFSAVDAHVGKHLFEKALTGELGQGRTRILVTHHVALCLPKTKYSVILENGTILQAGPTEELRGKGLLKDLLAFDIEEQRKEEEESGKQDAVLIDDGGSLQKVLSNRTRQGRRESGLSESTDILAKTRSSAREERATAPPPKKFVEDEKRQTGAIKMRVYKQYISACGGYGFWAFISSVFGVGIALYIIRSYWMTVWTRAFSTESTTQPSYLLQQTRNHLQHFRAELHLVQVDQDLWYYLGIYLGLALVNWLVGSFKYFCIYIASIRGSKVMFERLAHAVLRAPLRFLDTTPVGRLLNRFTADFNSIDSKIAGDIGFGAHSGISCIAVIIAGLFVSPLVLVAAALLLSMCFWYASRYLRGAREMKRLESTSKSPVFEQFGSVLIGIGTIRAFDKAETYIERIEEKINAHCQANFHLWLFTRWMGLRIAFVGSMFLTAMGILIVGLPRIDAPLAGFALSFSIQLSDCVVWMLRCYASLEIDMNAAERAVEYADMAIEDQSGNDAPAAWPTRGEIEVENLVVSYAPDLPPVLRDLTFTVRQNERVGVVGRTGAGKSSLTLALFRFLEARSGTIYIDGVDISKIKLFDLRSRLAIIPQDPVLFSGTIRSNLDAFEQHSDTELRDALARVHLVRSSALPSGAATPSRLDTGATTDGIEHDNTSDFSNQNIFTSLSSKITEGGLNLSQGQRQLLCLARAIVSRPKIMVLDEATSSVDMSTDALIQRSIRDEFVDSTLLVIAHRLSTIADFDRILVLGEGRVVEFDTPANLMRKAGGTFRSMVEESGERRELEAIIRGQPRPETHQQQQQPQ